MIETILDTKPLTAFCDNPTEVLGILATPYQAITLTTDGQPVAVLVHPDEYERLLGLASEASAEEGIRQGLADVAAGRTRLASEVFAEMRVKYNIPG